MMLYLIFFRFFFFNDTATTEIYTLSYTTLFRSDRAKFAASSAGDVNPETAAFMAESQVPWGVEALAGAITEPAWKAKPSWYLVVTDDRMIPPPAQRFMSKRAGSTVRESPGSHAIYVSRPAPVVALIEQAARALETASH